MAQNMYTCTNLTPVLTRPFSLHSLLVRGGGLFSGDSPSAPSISVHSDCTLPSLVNLHKVSPLLLLLLSQGLDTKVQ